MSAITTTLRCILYADPCFDPRCRVSFFDLDLDQPIDFNLIAGRLGIEFAIWAMRTAPEHDPVWKTFAIRVAISAGISRVSHSSGAISAYRTAKAAVEKRARERMDEAFPVRRFAEYTHARDEERRRQWEIFEEVLEEET